MVTTFLCRDADKNIVQCVCCKSGVPVAVLVTCIEVSYTHFCCITFFYQLTDIAVIALLDAIVEAMSNIRESL